MPALPPQLVPISVETLRANPPTEADFARAKAEYDSLFDPAQATLLQAQYIEKMNAQYAILCQSDKLERNTKYWNFAASFLGVFWGVCTVWSSWLVLISDDHAASDTLAMIGNAGVLLVSVLNLLWLLVVHVYKRWQKMPAKDTT